MTSIELAEQLLDKLKEENPDIAEGYFDPENGYDQEVVQLLVILSNYIKNK